MRAIILTRDKRAVIKKVNAKRVDTEFRNATYILDPDRIQNYKNEADQIEGSQVLFFEDNPNPITHEEKSKDLSSKYLDDIVLVNFIQQTTSTFGNWNMPDLSMFSWIIDNPARIPFLLMILLVTIVIARNLLGV